MVPVPATAPMFVPALVEALSSPAAAPAPTPRPTPKRARRSRAAPMVEVVIDGITVKIGRGADAATIAAVLGALKTPR